MNPNQLRAQLEDRHLTAAKLKELLGSLCAALRERGVVSVEASYWGSGDEGAVEEVSYLPDGVAVSQELHDTIIKWIEDVLPGGWEINDGGQGEVTINVIKATAEIEHGSNYTETYYESFEFGGDKA